MQIKTRAKDKRIAKGKWKAKETATMGPQAQNDAPIFSHPGGSLDTGEPSRLRRTLRTHAPLELRPAMDTDDDKHQGDNTESDADEEAVLPGSTYIGTGSRKPKKNGYCLDPKDPANFLKLASALNIFLADTLTDNQINEADNLIREYNLELIKVSRIPHTCPIFAVFNFICSALWAWCNKA